MSMLNEIYKQQHLQQTGQDAASRKRKREQALYTIDTFIDTCQTSQQYTLEMNRRKNDISNQIYTRKVGLRNVKDSLSQCSAKSYVDKWGVEVTKQRIKDLNKIIVEHERVIDDLKSQENNLVDEVNNKCTFHVPLGVIVAIRELVNDSI